MIPKKYKTSIFIFRRDLRLNDNVGLLNALHNSSTVIPIFIFTIDQLKNNIYKSNNCVQFMVESLDDLDKQLGLCKSRLYYFYGNTNVIINKLLTKNKVDAVYVNADFTPYSVKRDADIATICKNKKVIFHSCQDVLLYTINSITTDAGDIYTKFTPYFNKAKNIPVNVVTKNNYTNYVNKRVKLDGEYTKDPHKLYGKYNQQVSIGGRTQGLLILDNIKVFKKYNLERNTLSKKTTRLSAHIKFGTVSIREVYSCFKKKLGKTNDLIKQLYWRDFYYNVTFNNPLVLAQVGKTDRNFREKYSRIPWITYDSGKPKDLAIWDRWTSGTTGYPIVDACMRELNSTGFMHNRGRLITSNFLTKLMMWHWQEGEKYFAQNLVDYDPILNNGNWQWSAGSGVDAQPYFRIFNPWAQGIKFDEDCLYIKKWIPELVDVENDHIHDWANHCTKGQYKNVDYPRPMIDYEKSRANCLKLFKQALY